MTKHIIDTSYETNTQDLKTLKVFTLVSDQNLSESVAEKAGSDFVTTIARIVDAVGPQAFRISRSLNAAIFDSFAVAVARKPDKSSEIGRAHV